MKPILLDAFCGAMDELSTAKDERDDALSQLDETRSQLTELREALEWIAELDLASPSARVACRLRARSLLTLFHTP